MAMILIRITITLQGNMLRPHRLRGPIHMRLNKDFILKQANSHHRQALFHNNILLKLELLQLHQAQLHMARKVTHLLHLHQVHRRRLLKDMKRMLMVPIHTHLVVLKL